MHLTLLNLTEDSIVFTCNDRLSEKHHELLPLPSSAIHATLPKFCTATLSTAGEKQSAVVTIRLSGAKGGSWVPIEVPAGCPWRVYLSKCARGQYKLTVLPHRELASFLSDIPDDVPLSQCLLPGTHDTMAFYGWPFSQCQSISTPLNVQFRSGIRFLDIRLTPVQGRLIAYHGAYPQKTPFQDILITVHEFLTSEEGSRETVVMSIKQEAPSNVFSQLVHDEIAYGRGGRDMWFFESRVPTLGEVRGKVVLFSRFGNGDGWEGGLNGMGIHPTYWPDSEKDGFTWMCNDTVVRTNDWYSIPSFLAIPEKVALATAVIEPHPTDETIPALPITYFSAASFPLAAPQTIAQGFGWPKLGFGVEGVNDRLGKWALDQLESGGRTEKKGQPRIRGWVFLDYYEEPQNSLVPLLIEFNHRGRKAGQEGW